MFCIFLGILCITGAFAGNRVTCNLQLTVNTTSTTSPESVLLTIILSDSPQIGKYIYLYNISQANLFQSIRITQSTKQFTTIVNTVGISSVQAQYSGKSSNIVTFTIYQVPSNDPSALVTVEMFSTVGILLDEIMVNTIDSYFQAFKMSLSNFVDNKFWRQRMERQINLTSYRLIYRPNYYEEEKLGLGLPPSTQWETKLLSNPQFKYVNGHYLLAVDYKLTTIILTTHQSITASEPALGPINGQWNESYKLPIDPENLFDRVGYACIDEEDYPPNSADPETIYYMFDDLCEVEAKQDPNKVQCEQCHCTQLPNETCVQAMKRKIGIVKTNLTYTRIPYNTTLANLIRSLTPSPIRGGAELDPELLGLMRNRIIYRYFDNNSCEINYQEACIGGLGWRRLLLFETSTKNRGDEVLHILSINNNTLDDKTGQTAGHGLFEYSPCHQHYHFRHYGDFTLHTSSTNSSITAPTNSKRGFCLNSIFRWANAEWSPMANIYWTCINQGISPGWMDTYQAGIACQWLDITSVPSPVLGTLNERTNPDSLMCEGQPSLNSSGGLIWQNTNFKTYEGKNVQVPKCNFISGYENNNLDTFNVNILSPGLTYINQPCPAGSYQISPLKNCEFYTSYPTQPACVPKQKVTLKCSLPSSASYQILRICEYSKVLGVGVGCRNHESLANVVIKPQSVSGDTEVIFKCPGARNITAGESGGMYSMYSAPLWDTGKQPVTINCNVV